MSAIEYGIEKGYIEKQPTENEEEERYFIFPRRIALEMMLHKIIAEFNELGYDVNFDAKERIYVVTNKTILSKEKEKVVNNIDKINSVCDECKAAYDDLLANVKGSVCFISEDTKIDAKETAGILCSKIYHDIAKWIDEGGLKEIKEFEVTGEQLLGELDALIRSM